MNGAEWTRTVNARLARASADAPTAKVLEPAVGDLARSVASQTPGVRMAVTSNARSVTVRSSGPGAAVAQRKMADRIARERPRLATAARDATVRSL